jgi:hypothetical protein
MPQPFALRPEDYARPLNVVGEKITVLAGKAATQGYEIFLQDGVEGNGPPPHSHDWDEAFYVIKGTIEFTFAGKTMTATPGTLVHLPAGTVHSFRFCRGGGQIISMTGDKGQATKLFTEIDAEVPVGAPDIAKLVSVAERNGVAIAG